MYLIVGILLAIIGSLGMIYSAVFNKSTDSFGFSLGMAFLGLMITIIATVYYETKARDKFLAECMKDRKEYECVAMWRDRD